MDVFICELLYAAQTEEVSSLPTMRHDCDPNETDVFIVLHVAGHTAQTYLQISTYNNSSATLMFSDDQVKTCNWSGRGTNPYVT